MFAVAIYGGIFAFTSPGTLYNVTFTQAAQGLFFFDMTAVLLIPLSKVCVTLLLLEVEVSDSWRMAIMVIQSLILLSGLTNLAISFFACYFVGPHLFYSIITNGLVPEADNPMQQEKCVVRQYAVPVNGALNCFFEIAIFICAMSLVTRVRSTAWQKVGLTLSFGLGVFTIAVSIINTTVAYTSYIDEVRNFNVSSLIRQYHSVGIWTATEAYVGLAVPSILPIRASLLAFFSRIVALFKTPAKLKRDPAESGTSECTLVTISQHAAVDCKKPEAAEVVVKLNSPTTVADTAWTEAATDLEKGCRDD